MEASGSEDRIMSRKGPYTIGGETFPTLKAMGERFGVSMQRAHQWVSEGRTEPADPKFRAPRCKTIRFDGRVWPRMDACADFHGVTMTSLRKWIRMGLDSPPPEGGRGRPRKGSRRG